jgi:hypothetical protein
MSEQERDRFPKSGEEAEAADVEAQSLRWAKDDAPAVRWAEEKDEGDDVEAHRLA